jgi:outer membrane protein assembly factor BamB
MVLTAVGASAEEWPRWRGPRGDGISAETAFAKPWRSSGLLKTWSVPVGSGFSSPVGANGRVFLFHQKDGKELLTAFDAGTGDVVWEQTGNAGWTGDYPGTRATPVVEGKYVYTYGGLGDLTAWLQSDGSLVWHVNVLKAVGAHPLNWGVASSPLITADRIYVQTGVGGPIAVAVDKSTGELVWKAEVNGKAGYAPPVLVDVDGDKQVVLATAQEIVGLNPETGAKLWSTPFHIEIDVNAATPVYRDGLLFVTAAYNGGATQLRVGPSSASPTWHTRQVMARFNPAIFDDGYLYVNSESVIKCVDWRTGSVVWSADDADLRLGIGGSLVRVADKLVTLSDRGRLGLLEATPAGFKKVSSFQATTGGTVWATPLLYRNRIFVRGEKELSAWRIPN